MFDWLTPEVAMVISIPVLIAAFIAKLWVGYRDARFEEDVARASRKQRGVSFPWEERDDG